MDDHHVPETSPVRPLLAAADLACLRAALQRFTVGSVHDLLGPAGQAAHDRGDLAGVARLVRAAPDRVLATMIELLLLGRPVGSDAAAAALAPLSLSGAASAGLVEIAGDTVRAALEIRPYAEDAPGAAPWWVLSDLGSDVRPGPVATDHVLGIGAASLTLAQSTPRAPVGRALDVGTGSGVQALHLARHAGRVTATDISARALRMAATTAALSDQRWDLRPGSLLDPVQGERFDLVVANPPFVVSDGSRRLDYRDSGLAGDRVCRNLLTGLPGVLAPGGTAVVLANWIIDAEQPWSSRLGGWLADGGCAAWVWQREVADPGEYASLWLRDAGETPGTDRYRERYDAWLDWFAASGVLAIGMGLVALWPDAGDDPVRIFEDVPQTLAYPVGDELPRWVARQRWLAATSDEALWRSRLTVADDVLVVREQHPRDDGNGAASRLRLAGGMRWDVEADDAVTSLLAGCDGRTPLSTPLQLLAASTGLPGSAVLGAAAPVIRDLVGRGFLLPEAGPGTVAGGRGS